MTLRKHYFSNPDDEEVLDQGVIPYAGEFPPSPQMFHDVCALNDLMDLARESNPCSDDHALEGQATPFGFVSEAYERDLTNLARSHHRSHTQPNLTDTEKEALKSLNEDTNIIIRNADKGGSVVILDSTTYKEEAVHQLSDTVTYFKLRGDPTMSFKQEFGNLLDRAVAFFHKKRERYIYSRFSRYACVSFSPKSA